VGHFLLSADATFSAAHTLPGIEMCERMHGHNWRVRLTVKVDDSALDQVGMGVDFRVVERIANEVVADFEHRYLNELEAFRDRLPTAEHVAHVVATRAAARLKTSAPSACVAEVELWETPEYRLVYRP
jgi:6-pyruvoyltetrahydropterin/6-carboxytetrahydropterin synthase